MNGSAEDCSSFVRVWSSGDTHTYSGSLFFDLKEVRTGTSVTLLKEQGYHDLHFSLRGTNGLPKVYVHRGRKDSNPLSIIIQYVPKLHDGEYGGLTPSTPSSTADKHVPIYASIPREIFTA